MLNKCCLIFFNAPKSVTLLAVWLHFSLSACAQSSRLASLEQTISFNETKVEFCTQLTNTDGRALLVTAPFSLKIGDQLFLLFEDSNANLVSLKHSDVITGAPSPRPYPSDRINYDVLMPDTEIESCATYELSSIEQETVESYFIYKPWLRRSDKLPFNDLELSVRNGPIYNDEPLRSVKCQVNFMTKVFTCDGDTD